MKRATKDGAFVKVPNETFLKIFCYLDFESVLKARCVSRKWKGLIETSRNIALTCHLTDETVSTAVNSIQGFPSIKIHDFMEPIPVLSATRGVGRILAIAESIEISSHQINSDELMKVLRFTTKSLENLSLYRCGKSVSFSLLETSWTFECLTKLSIGFNRLPKRWHTRLFERLSENQPSFPSLTHLKILYEVDDVHSIYNSGEVPSSLNLFKNYLAIMQLVLAFKATLKSVEIFRDDIFRVSLLLQVEMTDLIMSLQRVAVIRKCIEELEEVQLESLLITPLVDEGTFPWVLESTLLGHQKQLQNITINRKLCHPRASMLEMKNLLPINPALFTSVKISLTSSTTRPIDLEYFGGCPNLQTLWIMCYSGVQLGPVGPNTVRFTNLEKLPTSLTSLHFKSSQAEPIVIHQQSLLTRSQVRWVVDNLRNLESLWLQLVTEERNRDVNNPALGIPPLEPINPENLGQGGDRNDNDDPGQNHVAPEGEAPEVQRLANQLNEEANVNANMDLTTFSEMLSLPKLKELKFDMWKASQLGTVFAPPPNGNIFNHAAGIHANLEDFQDYIDMCEEGRGISFQTEATSSIPFEFIELTINKRARKWGPYFTT